MRGRRGSVEVQLFGDCWVETVMRRKYSEITKDFEKRAEEKKKALVHSGGELDTEGLREDVKERFRHKGDGTVEVRKWISDVQWSYFHGPAKVCKEGELEKEYMPAWTRKVIARIWQGVLENVEAYNAHTKSIM